MSSDPVTPIVRDRLDLMCQQAVNEIRRSFAFLRHEASMWQLNPMPDSFDTSMRSRP